MTRDYSPIEQDWVKNYITEFIKIAASLPNGNLKDTIVRRVECVQDLVEAWQSRNIPIEKSRITSNGIKS